MLLKYFNINYVIAFEDVIQQIYEYRFIFVVDLKPWRNFITY